MQALFLVVPIAAPVRTPQGAVLCQYGDVAALYDHVHNALGRVFVGTDEDVTHGSRADDEVLQLVGRGEDQEGIVVIGDGQDLLDRLVFFQSVRHVGDQLGIPVLIIDDPQVVIGHHGHAMGNVVGKDLVNGGNRTVGKNRNNACLGFIGGCVGAVNGGDAGANGGDNAVFHGGNARVGGGPVEERSVAGQNLGLNGEGQKTSLSCLVQQNELGGQREGLHGGRHGDGVCQRHLTIQRGGGNGRRTVLSGGDHTVENGGDGGIIGRPNEILHRCVLGENGGGEGVGFVVLQHGHGCGIPDAGYGDVEGHRALGGKAQLAVLHAVSVQIAQGTAEDFQDVDHACLNVRGILGLERQRRSVDGDIQGNGVAVDVVEDQAVDVAGVDVLIHGDGEHEIRGQAKGIAHGQEIRGACGGVGHNLRHVQGQIVILGTEPNGHGRVIDEGFILVIVVTQHLVGIVTVGLGALVIGAHRSVFHEEITVDNLLNALHAHHGKDEVLLVVGIDLVIADQIVQTARRAVSGAHVVVASVRHLGDEGVDMRAVGRGIGRGIADVKQGYNVLSDCLIGFQIRKIGAGGIVVGGELIERAAFGDDGAGARQDGDHLFVAIQLLDNRVGVFAVQLAGVQIGNLAFGVGEDEHAAVQVHNIRDVVHAGKSVVTVITVIVHVLGLREIEHVTTAEGGGDDLIGDEHFIRIVDGVPFAQRAVLVDVIDRIVVIISSEDLVGLEGCLLRQIETGIGRQIPNRTVFGGEDGQIGAAGLQSVHVEGSGVFLDLYLGVVGDTGLGGGNPHAGDARGDGGDHTVFIHGDHGGIQGFVGQGTQIGVGGRGLQADGATALALFHDDELIQKLYVHGSGGDGDGEGDDLGAILGGGGDLGGTVVVGGDQTVGGNGGNPLVGACPRNLLLGCVDGANRNGQLHTLAILQRVLRVADGLQGFDGGGVHRRALYLQAVAAERVVVAEVVAEGLGGDDQLILIAGLQSFGGLEGQNFTRRVNGAGDRHAIAQLILQIHDGEVAVEGDVGQGQHEGGVRLQIHGELTACGGLHHAAGGKGLYRLDADGGFVIHGAEPGGDRGVVRLSILVVVTERRATVIVVESKGEDGSVCQNEITGDYIRNGVDAGQELDHKAVGVRVGAQYGAQTRGDVGVVSDVSNATVVQQSQIGLGIAIIHVGVNHLDDVVGHGPVVEARGQAARRGTELIVFIVERIVLLALTQHLVGAPYEVDDLFGEGNVDIVALDVGEAGVIRGFLTVLDGAIGLDEDIMPAD